MRANFVWKMLILTYTTFLIGLFSYEISNSFFTPQVSMEIEVNESKKSKPKLKKSKPSDKKPIILNEKPRLECFPADADLKYRKLNNVIDKSISKKELMKQKILKSLREKRDKLSEKYFKSKKKSSRKEKELELIDKKIQKTEQSLYLNNFDAEVKNETLLYTENCKEIK